ncbi:TatD-related deoxyribonuclease [Chitinispirillum alkaliphilum]|nr:TatD-related deoxyribonuclease [Chitinispirillum alkaliphilum]
MYLFDAHCHLQDKRVSEFTQIIIDNALNAGVERMVCCGCEPEDWARISYLARKYPEIVPSYGVHPWYSTELCSDWAEKLECALKEDCTSGVGEIGLDHTLDPSTFPLQKKNFSLQLEIASQLNRPVSIHCRKAWGELFSVFKSMKSLPRGLIHSYSGSPELVKQLEKLGFFISFSGSVCNPNNRKVQKSIKTVSNQRLLIESDSPDNMPYGLRSDYNQPANLMLIAKRAAFILNVPLEMLVHSTYQNALNLFTKN